MKYLMKDVRCPHCNKWIGINHDHGYGYEEDKVFTQICCECNKTFAYATTISFNYTSYKADPTPKGG